MRPVLSLCLLALCATGTVQAQQTPYLHAPAVNEYAKHDPFGTTIIPTGRLLHPVGTHTPLAQWPHGMSLSPDEKTLFVASGGVGQFITDWQSASPNVISFSVGDNKKKKRSSSGASVFSPDGKTLYWSSGESGEIFVLDVASHEVATEIPLNSEVGGKKYEDSFAMDIKLSVDGKYLYCADVTNFRVAVVDTEQKKVIGSTRVGRYPYALTVAGKHVYVANIGMFEYSPIGDPEPALITDAEKGKTDRRGLTRPPYGFPSKEAKEGVVFEGRKIPGLGEPNVEDSFSVWSLDMADPAHPKVLNKMKTGLLVGVPADKGKTVGGSAPNYVVVHDGNLYVSNYNNDMIERIGLAEQSEHLTPPKKTPKNLSLWKSRIVPSPLVAKLRGVGPCGMVLSPDGSRLYVAEAGINAIAVLDTEKGTVLGHIPTGWYPYRLTMTKDGKKLAVICFRGFSSGPHLSKNQPNSPFLGMKGLLSVLDVPTDADLKSHTANVLTYNGIVDKTADLPKMQSPVVPTTPGKASQQIKYVVFITKENHSYDAIFDHIPGANDDPSLLRWGYKQTIAAPGQPTLTDAAVMTNHNAIARQFTVSDNFYMEPEASGVGHRWLIGVQPNNWCQMTYTLGWDFKKDSSAPGRRASFGSNGSIAPEDYPEAGSMWEHLARGGKTFRNYGESFEFAGVGEDEDEFKTGAREVINMPMQKIVYDNTCFDFPIFNMNIPDQYRAWWFEQDFTKNFLQGKKEMPSFVNIAICNDHGTGPNPAKGYPYVASWMADNDLALGRIVDFLSHTKYWKNMAIFVTQDDSGGEPDHVDKQRSVLLAISPWIKRGYVSHRLTTIVSMHRTMYQLLGLPALNLFDGLANDFSDCFTTTPDFTPYKHVGVDPRIFDPEKAKDPKDPHYMAARKLPSPRMDDEEEEEKVLAAGANNKK